MDRLGEGRHSRSAIALMSGLLLLAGFSMVSPQPAEADDDDWHTEANRPIASQSQTDPDREDARTQVASKPLRETLYVPAGSASIVPPLRMTLTTYQTADVARPR